MDLSLTPKEAYYAMYSFLNELHEKYEFDQLGGLLGGMSVLEDGSTADPALWNDWLRIVEKNRLQIPAVSLGLK
jgi:hypothetical protein